MASEKKLNMLKDKLLTIRKKKSFSILRKENAGIRGCKGYKKSCFQVLLLVLSSSPPAYFSFESLSMLELLLNYSKLKVKNKMKMQIAALQVACSWL